VGITLIFLLFFVFLKGTGPTKVPSKTVVANPSTTITSSLAHIDRPLPKPEPPSGLFSAVWHARDAAESRQFFPDLHRSLIALPKDSAVERIRDFLDTHADRPSYLAFKIGSGGFLDEAPTLRTFLLDELAHIDPGQAAEYSRIILSDKNSPDEWALALRNLARGDSSAEGRALLEEKLMTMLQHEPWQREPSVGFLEAFDASVFIGGTNFVPTLSDLVRKTDNPGLAHAAFLALDRLVINEPISTLRLLKDTPDLMSGREATRANYFARSEVGDPGQREILESYLTSSAISPAEIEIFAGIFPNANYMVSNNLLTQSNVPDRASLVKRDAESLNIVRSWASDPRFTAIRPSLNRSLARLEQFVAQANHSL